MHKTSPAKTLPAAPTTTTPTTLKIGNTTISQKTIAAALKSSPIRTRRLSICHSPQLLMKKLAKKHAAANTSATATSGGSNNLSTTSTLCDVCRTQGSANDIVKYDELKIIPNICIYNV